MANEFLWVEKYRSRKIEDCILTDQVKSTFQSFLDNGEIPNLLLSGPPGIGKTTVAKALCDELGADYYVINGSDEGRFLTLYAIRRNPLLLLSLLLLRVVTKCSSLMRRITPRTTYNSSCEQVLKSSKRIAVSYSPATTRTASLEFAAFAMCSCGLRGNR